MSAHVLLTLDTTAPSLAVEINGGDATTDLEMVTLAVDAVDDRGDAMELRIWGAINPLDPTNADYAATEGDAPWIPYDSSFTIALSPGGGPKPIHVKVRDAVWNENHQVATITLTGEPLVPPAPPRPQQIPGSDQRPKPGTERKMVTARSTVRVRTSVHRAGTRAIRLTSPARLRTRVRMGDRTRRVEARSGVHPRTRVASTSFRVLGADSTQRIRTRGIVHKGDDQDLLAILLAASELVD